MTVYQSAQQRLQALPESFSLQSLADLLGTSTAQASVYAHRWVNGGLVARSGHRSAYFFNLVRNPESPRVYAHLALLNTYPRSLVIGLSALEAAGWIPSGSSSVLQVAVPSSSSRRARVDGFEVHSRSQKWFDVVSKAKAPTYKGLDCLSPALALADLCSGRTADGEPHAWIHCLDTDRIQGLDIMSAFVRLKPFGAAMGEDLRSLLAQQLRRSAHQEIELLGRAPGLRP